MAKYKRVLLKISGEALAGANRTGFDFGVMGEVCDVIKACVEQGVEVGVVIGGGNFWRGVKNGEGYIERTRADRMGMLATVMNCLAVSDVLEQKGVPARVMTAMEMHEFAEYYTHERAMKHLSTGKVVLFAGGTGHPFFSTDTGTVLRAAEIGADVILLAKNIDGVYSADPAKDPTARSSCSGCCGRFANKNYGRGRLWQIIGAFCSSSAERLWRARRRPALIFRSWARCATSSRSASRAASRLASSSAAATSGAASRMARATSSAPAPTAWVCWRP